jgi:hypothetical protein
VSRRRLFNDLEVPASTIHEPRHLHDNILGTPNLRLKHGRGASNGRGLHSGPRLPEMLCRVSSRFAGTIDVKLQEPSQRRGWNHDPPAESNCRDLAPSGRSIRRSP